MDLVMKVILITKTFQIMTKLTKTIPPKRGPNPQGLNIPLKQVKVSNTLEKINGRHRQNVTKRKNINQG